MEEKKIDISQDISLVSDERRKLLMGMFYEAESKAINNEIVRKSFDDVGSWSWNPQKNLEICQKHSSVIPQPNMDESV